MKMVSQRINGTTVWHQNLAIHSFKANHFSPPCIRSNLNPRQMSSGSNTYVYSNRFILTQIFCMVLSVGNQPCKYSGYHIGTLPPSLPMLGVILTLIAAYFEDSKSCIVLNSSDNLF